MGFFPSGYSREMIGSHRMHMINKCVLWEVGRLLGPSMRPVSKSYQIADQTRCSDSRSDVNLSSSSVHTDTQFFLSCGQGWVSFGYLFFCHHQFTILNLLLSRCALFFYVAPLTNYAHRHRPRSVRPMARTTKRRELTR